jgi:hypothetical protein
MCFIPIVKLFITHWSWLWLVPFTRYGNKANIGCDQSTRDAYSSYAPDPTSGVSRGLCKPDLCCGLSYLPALNTDFDCGFFRLPNWTHWLGLRMVPFAWFGNIEFDYWFLRLKWCLQRVWPVERWCLSLLSTWFHHWYIKRPIFAHSLIYISYRTY